MAKPSLPRLRAAVRTHGPLGLLGIAWTRLRRLLYLHEEHIWYEMPLDGALPELALPDDCELVQAANEGEFRIAAQTGKDVDQARELVAKGHSLWLAHQGGTAIFTCWIFRGSAPALAAHGGWFTLPTGVLGIEDSITNPAFRGKSLGPAAVAAVLVALREEGAGTLITKVAVDNAASHRAVQKLGMSKVALCDLTRVGPVRRVRVRDPRGTSGPLLVAALK